MTKANFLALLAAAGVGFTGGAAISFRPGPPASGTYPHALRIESPIDGPERIEAYLTRATSEPDGGADLEDLGSQQCRREDGGSTTELRQWVTTRCPLEDGGTVEGVYVVEARPTGADDGGVGEVALEVYGTNGAAKCSTPKLLAFRRFVGALDCPVLRRRAGTSPL